MAGVAVLNDRLYVLGGSDSAVSLALAEVYNPALDRWKGIAAMNSPRSGLGVVVLDGLIYAVGGYDGTSNLNTMESYSATDDEWTEEPAMAVCRRRFSCC